MGYSKNQRKNQQFQVEFGNGEKIENFETGTLVHCDRQSAERIWRNSFIGRFWLRRKYFDKSQKRVEMDFLEVEKSPTRILGRS